MIARVAAVAVGTLSVAGASAAPFTVDSSTSYLGLNSLGIGFAPLSLGASFGMGTGSGSITAASVSNISVLPSGLIMHIADFRTGYSPSFTTSVAQINIDLDFTPTVPNLSYNLDGYLDIVQEGSPTFMRASSTIDLSQMVGLGVIHYRNQHTYTGPCFLWQPEAQELGTRSGDLVMGVPLRLSVRFAIQMTHGGDISAMFGRTPVGSTPFFRLALYQRPCDGDLSGDGFVDDDDFALFAAAYSLLDCADPAMPLGCPSDLNHDGFVDDSDFVLFAAAYESLLCP